MTVFADTSALYAVLVKTEAGHEKAASVFATLLKRGRPLVTSNYVLVETLALLQRRIGMPAVRDFQDHIVPVLAPLWITEQMHGQAVERLIRTDRRALSLTDCASFVLMESEGIGEAFALDSDFAAAGFKVIPATR